MNIRAWFRAVWGAMVGLTPRFTTDGYRVIKLAQKESERMAHGYISPEQVLVALVKDEGAAGQFLRVIGLDGEQVEAALHEVTLHWSMPADNRKHNFVLLDHNGELIGSSTPVDKMSTQDRDELLAGLREAEEGATEIIIGHKVWMAISGRMGEIGRLVILRDVTDIRGFDQEYAIMMAVMAHDLRSPIHVITGYAEVLQENTPVNDEQKKMIGGILKGTRMMNRTIDATLDAANLWRVTSDVRTRVDFRAIIEKIAVNLQNYLRSEATIVQIDPNTDDWWVVGDEEMLRHLAQTVIGFGVWRFEALKDTTVKLSRNATDIQLRVEDRGGRIKKDELPHIFDKYAHTRWLGLWRAREVIESYGGTISAEIIPEGGVAFVVNLPAAKTSEE